jgi:hypothetical protein
MCICSLVTISKARDSFFRNEWDRTLTWVQPAEVTWRKDYLDKCPQSKEVRYWRIMREYTKKRVSKLMRILRKRAWAC